MPSLIQYFFGAILFFGGMSRRYTISPDYRFHKNNKDNTVHSHIWHGRQHWDTFQVPFEMYELTH